MSADLDLFGKLPTAEVRLIKAVLNSDADVSLVIPDTVTPVQLMEQLQVLCGAARELEFTRDKLLPVIGRLMLLCQENPETYLGAGYVDWKDFKLRGIQDKFGLSRTSAYFAMQTAKQWSRLTIKEYGEIGRAKMSVLNAIGSQNGMSSRSLVNKAKALSSREFREWAISTGRLERGEDKGAFISIPCSGALKTRWERMLRTPAVIAAVESDSPARILEAMMEEFASVWSPKEEK